MSTLVDRFNRQLHPEERQWATDNANKFAQFYKEQTGQTITADQAQQMLLANGYCLVDAAASKRPGGDITAVQFISENTSGMFRATSTEYNSPFLYGMLIARCRPSNKRCRELHPILRLALQLVEHWRCLDQSASAFLSQAHGMLPADGNSGPGYMFYATPDQKANPNMYAGCYPKGAGLNKPAAADIAGSANYDAASRDALAKQTWGAAAAAGGLALAGPVAALPGAPISLVRAVRWARGHGRRRSELAQSAQGLMRAHRTTRIERLIRLTWEWPRSRVALARMAVWRGILE